jgi:hypothetical protein
MELIGHSASMVLLLEPVSCADTDVSGLALTIPNKATTAGHMIVILNTNDFEFYSVNSKGGIQGNGYQCRNTG